MQSSFEKAIEDAVRRAYISGRTGESLTRRMNDAVRQAVKGYGAKATLRAGKDYAKKVVSQLDAESLKVFSTDKDVATKAMKNSSKLVMDFAKRLDKVDEKASKNIIEAITSLNPGETDWRTAARAAMQKAGLAKHHAKTEIETFAGAMDRARVVDTALEGGIRRFKYVGPSGTQRPFCKGKVGVTFEIDAIKGMKDNGQGLPGIYYCGGYNCRHRWVPVLEGELKLEEGVVLKKEEERACAALTRYGHNVYYKKASNTEKKYDALVDNEPTEIKTLTEGTQDGNDAERIRQDMRKAHLQGAVWVVLNIEKEVELKVVIRGILEYKRRSSKVFKKVSIIRKSELTTKNYKEY